MARYQLFIFELYKHVNKVKKLLITGLYTGIIEKYIN